MIRSGNNLIIKAFVNDVLFYNGQLNNVDEGLFSGNMIMMLDPVDGPGLKEWSLDEVDIRYNPLIQTPGVFLDEFNDPNSPWFRFGDFDNVAQSITINNGQLNFNYSGTSETALYVKPPVGAVTDFSIEIETGIDTAHHARFDLSRFFDSKNYTTFFIKHDTLYFGYATNSFEPTVINNAAINHQTVSKLKFSIEGSAPVLYKAWANDQLVISGTLNNVSERLAAGQLAFGFFRGMTMDAYITRASITYQEYITEVKHYTVTNPEKYLLFQNYPNPFNPSTIIRWQSPVVCWQSLKIYDVLGNEVAVLVDEEKAAGVYKVDFDASVLTSGVYFYKLKSGSYLETKK